MNLSVGEDAFFACQATSRIEKGPAGTRPYLPYSHWARRSGRTPALPYPSAQQRDSTPPACGMQDLRTIQDANGRTCRQPAKR